MPKDFMFTVSTMPYLLDFDSDEGPMKDESQDEFRQRLDIRSDLWAWLERVIMIYLKGRYLMDCQTGRVKQKMRWLREWGLISLNDFHGIYNVWHPTDKGIAFYFSDRKRS